MVAQKVGYFMETEEKKIYTIEDIARELGVSRLRYHVLFQEREESVRLQETEYGHL